MIDFSKDDNEEIMTLACKHHFHDNCITQWFKHGKDSCPMCKQKAAHVDPVFIKEEEFEEEEDDFPQSDLIAFVGDTGELINQGFINLDDDFDPDYAPTDLDVENHALGVLGMFPRDKDLFFLAREALTTPLPDGWTRILTRQQTTYYHHYRRRWIQREHPQDTYCRKRYHQVKGTRDLRLLSTRPEQNSLYEHYRS